MHIVTEKQNRHIVIYVVRILHDACLSIEYALYVQLQGEGRGLRWVAAVCRGRHSALIVHTEIQIATSCRYIQIQGPDGGSSGSDTIMQVGIIEWSKYLCACSCW